MIFYDEMLWDRGLFYDLSSQAGRYRSEVRKWQNTFYFPLNIYNFTRLSGLMMCYIGVSSDADSRQSHDLLCRKREIMAQYLTLFLLAIDSTSSFLLRSLCVTLSPLFMSRPFIRSPATTIIPFLSLTEFLAAAIGFQICYFPGAPSSALVSRTSLGRS